MFAAGLAATALWALGGVAGAAEISVASVQAMKEVLDDLGPNFERGSRHKLALKFATVGELTKRIRGGESADVIIIQRQVIEGLVKEGKAASGSVAVLASSGIVVVVRKGAPKPDISSPEALKRALLNAKSITYGNPAQGGASAAHFAKVLERLGIEKEMKTKTIFSNAGGDTGLQVANGNAELGVSQRQIFMPIAGIEVVGPLPGELQSTNVFAAAVMTSAKDPAAAKSLVGFLRTPEAAEVIRTKGMDPGN